MKIPFEMAAHYGLLAILRDMRKLCVVVAIASLLANFLPPMRWLRLKLRRNRNVDLYCYFYSWIIDIIATIALNFRVQLPALDREMMGFRRIVRHRIRNLRQNRIDRKYNDSIHQRRTTH